MNRLLGIARTERDALRAFGVFDLDNNNRTCPFERRAPSVVQDKIGDLDRFRRSIRLIGCREPFNGNSHQTVGGHDELERFARGPRLMKFVAITGSSYFVYSRTIIFH
ncbi:MAG: hypothetical protein SGJ26_15840 [Nitrospirota bacterium]|nr:hypothetical protein [Nitrospirota bacterium]